MCKDNEWDEKKKEKKKKKKSKAEQCKANRAEQRSTAKHRKQEQIKSRVKQGKVAQSIAEQKSRAEVPAVCRANNAELVRTAVPQVSSAETKRRRATQIKPGQS